MKKRMNLFALTLVIILVTLSFGCGDSNDVNLENDQENDDEVYVMKVAGTFNDDSFMGIEVNDYFKPYVEEKSNGRIKVEVYLNSTLGSDREIVEGMQMNTIQGAVAPVNVIANFNCPKLNAISMPYIFKDREDAYNQLDGEFGEYMAEGLPEELGIRSLIWSESAIRNLSNNSREILTPDDAKGMKYRVMEATIDMEIIKSLGGSPTPMAFNELYTGLQQGTVDGQDNGLVMTYQMKFYEVQDYYTVTEQYFLANGFVVSEAFYQSLPEDLQKVVADGAEYAIKEGRKIVVEQEEECVGIMEDAGMKITYLTDDQKDKFKEATSTVWDKIDEIVVDEKAIEMAKEIYAR